MDRRQSINKRHNLYPYSDRLMTSTLQQLSFNCFTMTYINPLYDFYRWRSYQPQYLENETKFVSLGFLCFRKNKIRFSKPLKKKVSDLPQAQRATAFH